MKIILCSLLVVLISAFAHAAEPFDSRGPLHVAKVGTHLEHTDGTPFFILADTCWTGPALSTEKDWAKYLQDRKTKGFTAIQFNMVSPWRTAPADAEGNQSYSLNGDKLVPIEAFYKRLDVRLKAINDAGLLAVPVLCWAHKKGDAGKELNEAQLIALIKFEVERYQRAHVLWILAGDNQYTADTPMWKRIGRAVFGENSKQLVTTHPTGMNFPWKDWEDEKWLTVLGYQSGHGDDANTSKWIHSGPPAEYGKRKEFTRPIINLEPPYESHNGYQSKKPHSDYSVRRAVYWSLLNAPVAGVTYGGHGVWSWHTKPGEGPTDHLGTGIAKIWSEALDLPGAAQMGYARKFFETVPWMKLRPNFTTIDQREGKDDPNKYISCAMTTDHSTFVMYYPAGASGQIKLHIRGITSTGEAGVKWFNPRTGEWVKGGGLSPPDANDWVLVVRP